MEIVVGIPRDTISFTSGLLNNLAKIEGDAAIAAMSVANRFAAFVMCVGLGIGQGYQPVAAFNYQAKKYDRVKKGLLVTMAVGFCMIAMLAVPGMIFAEEIVHAFQKSEGVAKIGVPALRYACLGTMFLPLSVPVNMLYQSIRKPLISSIISMLRSGLMFIPTLLITTSLWGIVGIQISQPIADVLTGIASIPFILMFLRKKDSEMES